jgi:hypothetical protein
MTLISKNISINNQGKIKNKQYKSNPIKSPLSIHTPFHYGH